MGAIAAGMGRAADGAAVMRGTAAFTAFAVTETAAEGVIGVGAIAGTSAGDNEDNGDNVNDKDGAFSAGPLRDIGSGADGTTGAVRTEILLRNTCAAAGEGAAKHAAVNKASARLTSPL